MASYDVEGSPGAEAQKEPDSKKISFRFCREWYVLTTSIIMPNPN
jgi:hypothetical protein